ncbi:MAG: hypothetical protein LBU32_15505 [Clostridiales bacterium]|nr:hypothetical protein [Clostridiales bacterium]
MKSLIDVNLEEVFANSAVLAELSTMIFGAELALNYANVPDNLLKAITDRIVQSAFASFSSFNYNAMYAESQAKKVSTPSSPIMNETLPFYTSAPSMYSPKGMKSISDSSKDDQKSKSDQQKQSSASGFDYLKPDRSTVSV